MLKCSTKYVYNWTEIQFKSVMSVCVSACAFACMCALYVCHLNMIHSLTPGTFPQMADPPEVFFECKPLIQLFVLFVS